MRDKQIHIDKSKLRHSTFWDVNFEEFDPNEHIEFVIHRITHRGCDSEINYLLKFISFNKIVHILENYRGTDKIVLNFYKKMANAYS